MKKKFNPDFDLDISKLASLRQFYIATQPMLDSKSAIARNLSGIAHTSARTPVPENKDSYGLTFFTRPQLCLNDRNLRNDRLFYNLLTNNHTSIARYIRGMLDPRMHYAKITCPFVDPLLGFIPVLTNNLTSMSGWPDINMDTHTSKQGLRREAWSMADAPLDIYDAFDISCTFKNTQEEPIVMLMYYWIRYMMLVFDGTFSPYLDFILENEIDYNTRIYRLVMDPTQRFVKKIAATGASFPLNVPFARFFDFNDTTPYNMQTKDIDITFKCNGASYNDPILIDEFNAVQGIFHAGMRVNAKGEVPKFTELERIPYALLTSFNYTGYPYINPVTMELEWYVSKNSPHTKLILDAYNAIL